LLSGWRNSCLQRRQVDLRKHVPHPARDGLALLSRHLLRNVPAREKSMSSWPTHSASRARHARSLTLARAGRQPCSSLLSTSAGAAAAGTRCRGWG
jgi:hypothetical protein